ncbi:MAG: transposase [Planctomycetota bacterium]
MVIASHVIFSAYGFWLPNDPRGSWSEFVRSWDLFRFGPATKTTERRSVARKEHDIRARLAAKEALQYPPVKFTGLQALAVGRGMGEYAAKAHLAIWACAIVPDHVHMVVARHRLSVEQIVIQLKGAATRRLLEEDIHPLSRFVPAGVRPPKAFGKGQWKVFLNTPDDIARAISYVDNNPLRENLPAQSWSFVTSYSSRRV